MHKRSSAQLAACFVLLLTACQPQSISPTQPAGFKNEAVWQNQTRPEADFSIQGNKHRASPTPSPTPSPSASPTPTPSPSLSPSPTPSPSSGEDLSVEVAGWYNDGWDDESHAVYTNHNQLFSEVNPYWYNLGTSDGGTEATKTDGSVYERSYVYNATKVNQVHSGHDLVIPTIGDNAAGQINKILASSTARQALINNLVQKAVNRNYDGFDINFELGQATGQAAFALFVDDLAKQLHAVGKRLSVTIKAADSATAESWEIFDYQRLGQTAADRFKVMMYDHNFDAGANVPGPIADYNWMVSSLKYMISRGLPPGKIQLGLHNYAWVWKQGSNGSYSLQYPFSTWSAVQAKTSVFQWNSTAKEAWTDYSSSGLQYRTYIGDAQTVAQRLPLVKTFGLAGVVFWTLGREDQRIYADLPLQFG
ncbi:MAG: glycosyl hydrolase family 18 protein [Candidatus Sericytochromatia bacterium]